MPYGNKAFEHDFVNVPEKEPIRIVYEIISPKCKDIYFYRADLSFL
jgi:hypothetical protein